MTCQIAPLSGRCLRRTDRKHGVLEYVSQDSAIATVFAFVLIYHWVFALIGIVNTPSILMFTRLWSSASAGQLSSRYDVSLEWADTVGFKFFDKQGCHVCDSRVKETCCSGWVRNVSDNRIKIGADSLTVWHLNDSECVLFGKAEKSHPCNAQWVKIFAGDHLDRLHPVGGGPLKNDSTAEIKPIRNKSKIWAGKWNRASESKDQVEGSTVSGDWFGRALELLVRK